MGVFVDQLTGQCEHSFTLFCFCFERNESFQEGKQKDVYKRQVLNGNLVVNSNNEGGVAGINFFFCKDNRHWTSFAQSIYKLIHNKYSFLSVLTVDLSILFFNRIFKNIDNISRKSSSDRFSQSKKIFFQCSKF